MTRQSGDPINPDYLRQNALGQNACYAESIPRYLAGNDGAIAATGVALAVAVPLQAGDVVTNITFITGGTAAVSPTAGFVALYSSAATPALLAQSADFGSTARAANTLYKIALATAQTVTTAGIYYVSISFTAGTVPTLRGVTVGNAAVAGATGQAVLVQSHGSALGATAPATIATPTTTSAIPYILCS
jgi:hypothetical protein